MNIYLKFRRLNDCRFEEGQIRGQIMPSFFHIEFIFFKVHVSKYLTDS